MEFTNSYDGEDIHIIRNGKDFDVLAYINVQAGAAYNFFPSFHQDVFIGPLLSTFPSHANSYNGISATSFTLEGITVNRATGIISATSHTNPTIANFYLWVCEYFSSTNSETYRRLRVHVHDQINSISLTPNPMTIRSDVNGLRFAVLASFQSTVTVGSTPITNQVSADITYYSNFYFTFNSAPSFLTKDTMGVLTISGTPSAQVLNNVLTVGVPDYLRNSPTVPITANGSLEIKQPLANSFVVKRLNKGKTMATNNANNILLVGDGFTSESLFNQCVSKVVTKANKNTYLSPFNHFDDSINYWQLYFPSDEEGCTIPENVVLLSTSPKRGCTLSNYINACDNLIRRLDLLRSANSQFAVQFGAAYSKSAIDLRNIAKKQTDQINLNFSQTVQWNQIVSYVDLSATVLLSDLVYTIGLPVLSDQSIGLSTKISQWRSLPTFPTVKYEGESSAATFVILNSVYAMWQKMADRLYLNHTNTALGVRVNGLDPISYYFNKYRTDKVDMNKLVHGATFNGNNIGGLFSNAAGVPQSSGNNIIILTNSFASGFFTSMNVGDSINGNSVFSITTRALSEKKPSDIVFNISASNKPVLPSISLNDDSVFTTWHEFCHNYLRDEYAIPPAIPLPAANATNYDNVYNLHAKQKLLVGSNINPDLIKWNWPRIKKIGVLGAAVNSSGTSFTITINETNKKYPFKKNDWVLLRSKILKPHSYLDTSFSNGTPPNTIYSPIMQITAINGNQYTLTSSSSISLNFPVDSYLICYAQDSNNMPLLLVHENVRNEMRTQNMGLVEQDDLKTSLQKPTFPIPGLKSPSTPHHIAGLYAGGDMSYSENIYHATGICIMRSASAQISLFKFTPDPTVTNSWTIIEPTHANAFCPACKYIVVDMIDPLKHPEIDKEYSSVYPTF